MRIPYLFTMVLFFTCGHLMAQEEHHLSDSHDYKNKFALFGGYSSDLNGHVGPKIGFEYIRVMNNRISLRLALDYLGEDFKYTSISGTFDFKPFRNIPFYTGIGFGGKGNDEHWDPFTRMLFAYDIHFGRCSIGPLVMYDIYSIQDYFTLGLGFDYSF